MKPVLKTRIKQSGIADFSSVSFETGVFLREGNEPIASSLAVGDCPRTKDGAERNRGCVKATSQSQARLQLATAHEPKMKRSGIVVAKFYTKENLQGQDKGYR
jgi:hypothetical protein